MASAPVSEIDFRRPTRQHEQSASGLSSAVEQSCQSVSTSKPAVQPLLDAISEAGLKPVVLATVQSYSSHFAVKRITDADTVLQ